MRFGVCVASETKKRIQARTIHIYIFPLLKRGGSKQKKHEQIQMKRKKKGKIKATHRLHLNVCIFGDPFLTLKMDLKT